MALNIKNERTVRLAREYAAMTGQSVTGAITVALERSIAEAHREDDDVREDRLARLLELSRRSAPAFEDGPPAERAADFLYDDETGLPT